MTDSRLTNVLICELQWWILFPLDRARFAYGARSTWCQVKMPCGADYIQPLCLLDDNTWFWGLNTSQRLGNARFSDANKLTTLWFFCNKPEIASIYWAPESILLPKTSTVPRLPDSASTSLFFPQQSKDARSIQLHPEQFVFVTVGNIPWKNENREVPDVRPLMFTSLSLNKQLDHFNPEQYLCQAWQTC